LKVAIPAEGPDLSSRVGDRLGLSPYVLFVDLECKHFEPVRNPRTSGNSAGMQVVALIIAKQSNVVLTKWCSPIANKYLSASGVKILTGIDGSVAEALEKFEKSHMKSQMEKLEGLTPISWKIDRRVTAQAVRSASNQIRNLLPVVIGVIFLVGLFTAFISKESLAALFSGSMWKDSFWGTSVGSLFAGNPVNSYVIGRQLLDVGISIVAVTALICSWVTVGLAQLSAESAALGWKFAVSRNLSCFGLSMAIGLAMMFILGFLGA